MDPQSSEVIDQVPAPTIQSETPAVDASEAARQLAAWRHQKQEQPEAPVEAAPDESPEKADSAPQDEVPAEQTEVTEPAEELPPIDAPRSWTRDEKERFQSLPRETQEYIAQREQERDREIRRSQNEAAEAQRSIETARQQAEQARQEYEQKLPVLMQVIQSQAGEFADITTQADVMKMATEDPARYLRYDAHMKQVDAVQNELIQAQQRQSQEATQAWAKYAQEQDKRFAEEIPDILDPEKATKIRDSAVNLLRDTGFTEQELAQLWAGQSSLPLRDHRLQLLILDAARYREAKAKVAKAPQKPVPKVQRPGVAQDAGAQRVEQIQGLAEKLSNSKGMDAVATGVELLHAMRKNARK